MNLKRQGFIGYGELGRQIAAMVSAGSAPEQIRYFDDVCHGAGLSGALPMERYAEEAFGDLSFFVCLGYKHLKKNWRWSIG